MSSEMRLLLVSPGVAVRAAGRTRPELRFDHRPKVNRRELGLNRVIIAGAVGVPVGVPPNLLVAYG